MPERRFEMLFSGVSLRRTAERVFLENRDPTEDMETFVMALRNCRIRQYRPQSTHHHGKRTAATGTGHTRFIREDGIRK